MFTRCTAMIGVMTVALLLWPTGTFGASRYHAKNRTREVATTTRIQGTLVASRQHSQAVVSTNCHSHPGGATHCHC